MKLALFDLDHTLIPFDSGMAWMRFLVARGVLPPDAEAVYLGYCQQYVAGTLDIRAMHRSSVAPLSRASRASQHGGASSRPRWRRRCPQAMRELVAQHRDAGDLCAIVTATTLASSPSPSARLFGVADVLATEALAVDERSPARSTAARAIASTS